MRSQTIVSDPLPNESSKLKPNWSKFYLHDDMKLWWVVALSMGIRPNRKVIEEYKSQGSKYLSDYNARFALVRASVSFKNSSERIWLIESHPNNGKYVYYKMVNMHSFVQWAKYKKIPIPKEMVEKWGNCESDNSTIKDDDLHPRARSTYQYIVGALLELMLDKIEKRGSSETRSGFKNQAEIIATLAEDFPKGKGLSKRNLETIFSDVRKTFDMSN